MAKYESITPFCHSDFQDRRIADPCRYSWEWGWEQKERGDKRAVRRVQPSDEGTDSYLRQIEVLTHISPFWRLIESNDKKIYYYSPNKQFHSQIERMRSIAATVSGCKTGPTATNEYRLDSNWFYFKLCDPYEFKPVSPDLADGIYIPLEYMDLLLKSPQVRSTGGGIKITYKNVERHFPNSFFMKLVEEGLIGSYPETSERIFAEVEQSLDNNRSVTLAWKNMM